MHNGALIGDVTVRKFDDVCHRGIVAASAQSTLFNGKTNLCEFGVMETVYEKLPDAFQTRLHMLWSVYIKQQVRSSSQSGPDTDCIAVKSIFSWT